MVFCFLGIKRTPPSWPTRWCTASWRSDAATCPKPWKTTKKWASFWRPFRILHHLSTTFQLAKVNKFWKKYGLGFRVRSFWWRSHFCPIPSPLATSANHSSLDCPKLMDPTARNVFWSCDVKEGSKKYLRKNKPQSTTQTRPQKRKLPKMLNDK